MRFQPANGQVSQLRLSCARRRVYDSIPEHEKWMQTHTKVTTSTIQRRDAGTHYLGLSFGGDKTIKRPASREYPLFIRSTSLKRKMGFACSRSPCFRPGCCTLGTFANPGLARLCVQLDGQLCSVRYGRRASRRSGDLVVGAWLSRRTRRMMEARIWLNGR